jgi:TRAP transporter TAXI family solute receptor
MIAKGSVRAMGLALALLVGGTAAAAAQTQMVITTGPIGGAWYPIGSGMVEILQKQGLQFTQQPGGGVSNAFNVGAGKAQLGFTTADVANAAVNGKSDFDGRPQKNLRLLAALYPQQYTLVVWADSPIKSVSDLKGRVIQTTPRGSSTELMTRRVLEAHGLSYSDLKSVNHSNVSDGVNQMKDGQVDGMSHLITNPAPHAVDLSSSRPIRIVSLEPAGVEKLTQTYQGYSPATIKAGLYPGQTGEVRTIGEAVILITRAELGDDTVYKITKALLENRTHLANIHKVMADFTPAYAVDTKALPVHPGALKFYKEAGVAK